MPTSRIVAFLTPVLTVVSAVGSGFIARHTGINFSPDELLAIEVSGATAALGAGVTFLHHHAKLESEIAQVEAFISKGVVTVEKFDPAVAAKLRAEAEKLLTDARAEVEHLISSNAKAIADKHAELQTRESAVAARETAVSEREHSIAAALKPFADPALVIEADQANAAVQAQAIPADDTDTTVPSPAEQAQEPVPVIQAGAATPAEQTQTA